MIFAIIRASVYHSLLCCKPLLLARMQQITFTTYGSTAWILCNICSLKSAHKQLQYVTFFRCPKWLFVDTERRLCVNIVVMMIVNDCTLRVVDYFVKLCCSTHGIMIALLCTCMVWSPLLEMKSAYACEIMLYIYAVVIKEMAELYTGSVANSFACLDVT